MNALIEKIKALEKTEINKTVENRLVEFSSFSKKASEEWFSELCFCILAANSKQKTAEAIQRQISINLINSLSEEQLAQLIRNNKHRFHNNKSKYIKSAIQFSNIKDLLKDKSDLEARIWLVKNIKGIGYKEASHFLRNTGTTNLAILDRHIINTFVEEKIIEKPKTLTPKAYLEIEKKFLDLAKNLNMSPAKLDLLIWYMKTGEVAK